MEECIDYAGEEVEEEETEDKLMEEVQVGCPPKLVSYRKKLN
jgi:hypothetical protein